jgi:HlyD family secretion protein
VIFKKTNKEVFFFLGLMIFPFFSNAQPSEMLQNSIDMVGALGVVEPRSRVINVSHNAGAEGVNLQQVFVQEGSQSSKGDVLAILADHDKKQADLDVGKANILALNAKLESEKINLDFTEKERIRYEALAKNSLASRSFIDSKVLAFNQSQAKVRELQGEISAARASLKLLEQKLKDTIILAPLSGTILKVHSHAGERLNDIGLLEMADLTELDVVAEVYETDLPKVEVGQNAEIIVPGINSVYTAAVREIGYQVKKNDLNSTDPLADKDNRIIEVRLTLDNKAVIDLQHQIYRQVQVRIKI